MVSYLDSLLIAILAALQLCFSTAHVVPPEATDPPRDSGLQRHVSPDLFESLEELARIVDIAYCIGSTGVQKPFQCLSHCRELKGFELINAWHTGPFLSDSSGYIALSHPPSPKRIIVSFRGTYSIANAIVDLSAYPQEYVPYPVGNDTDDDTPKCTNCFVHMGFMNAWRATRTKVLETIEAVRDQYPGYALTLVGHSLGGAVAALAGTEMQLRGWNPVVTTFGEPRVGNKAFVEYLDKVFQLDSNDARDWKFRRLTHVNDPVPLVPLTEWGYEMHGGEIYISRVELPFSVNDIKYCDGAHDERCISEMERTTAKGSIRASLQHELNSPGSDTGQQVLSSASSPPLPQPEDSQDHTTKVLFDLTSRLAWSILPPRFRLWELFYSHRDYFLRLGLCVPGGDPTGRW